MYEAEARWERVDRYLLRLLVPEDDALRRARTESHDVGLPAHEVAPNQGAFLGLLTRLAGARRVLEIGTLGGYSTIWFARSVGSDGWVTSLEVDPDRAAVAQRNLARAGVAERVEVVVAPAMETLDAYIAESSEPFDVVFIDADKPRNPQYLAAALQLSRPGTVIVADNVVRDGAVTDENSKDPSVIGIRRFLEMVRDDPRLDATALQTVGVKGWDGLVIALRR